MTHPNPHACPPTDRDGGMTLRDYFAAAALTGLLAYTHPGHNPGQLPPKGAAEEAYAMADAMLAARAAAPKE